MHFEKNGSMAGVQALRVCHPLLHPVFLGPIQACSNINSFLEMMASYKKCLTL